MIILFGLLIWLIVEVVFFILHRNPLNEEEILKLSQRRTHKYIKKNYTFNNVPVAVNKEFKSSLKPNGCWYNANESLASFPSYIAALLKGKKHEWVVLAIEKDGLVYGFYANKGHDNSSVSFNCDLEYIMEKCKEYGCSTIMRFHNHPNENPSRQTCLLASEQDKSSALWCSGQVGHLYNWLDFVCERGSFIKFFEQYSPAFIPKIASHEHIRTENNTSRFKNYKLHRELGLFHYSKSNSKNDFSKNQKNKSPTTKKANESKNKTSKRDKIKIILIIVLCISLRLGMYVILGYNDTQKENLDSDITTIVDETCTKPTESTTEKTPSTQIDAEKEDKSETKPKKEIIDISSEAYYDLIKNVFEDATAENGYYVLQSYDTFRAPYLQMYIAPKDKYSDDVTKTQSTELIKNVLDQLKKYEYKSGGFFKRECEYINIYFYGFGDNGSYHRNGGPFIQINVFDIQNVTVEEMVF